MPNRSRWVPRALVPRTLAIGLAVATVGLAACASGSASTAARGRATRVVIVMEENHSLAAIQRATNLPQINHLARTSVLLDDYFAIAHPSLPNYLALTSGSTFGFKSDCGSCTVNGPNLFDQLQHAHITWRLYAQGLPKPCSQVTLRGAYARRHVPALLYDSVRKNPAACANVVPYTQLAVDIREHHLPQFAMVIPDLSHDMHGISESADDPHTQQQSDAFVGSLYSTLQHSAQWGDGSRFVVTFDEGGGYSPPPHTCCSGEAAGGHIPTIIAGPGLTAHKDGATYDHYSLLRSIETAFGLPFLGRAATTKTHGIPAITGS
jgi:phospholipase C